MIADFILDKSAFPHCFLVIRRPYLRGRPSFPSPEGEGRVRGLFLGMGEGQNNEAFRGQDTNYKSCILFIFQWLERANP